MPTFSRFRQATPSMPERDRPPLAKIVVLIPTYNERENLPLITEILALRYERAQLLGYADFAAFKLEPEMAGTAERVEELLTEVWNAAKKRADADGAALAGMMQQDGINAELAPLRDGSPLAARMAETGGRLVFAGPDELAQRLRRELPLWRQVVAEAGIKPE